MHVNLDEQERKKLVEILQSATDYYENRAKEVMPKMGVSWLQDEIPQQPLEPDTPAACGWYVTCNVLNETSKNLKDLDRECAVGWDIRAWRDSQNKEGATIDPDSPVGHKAEHLHNKGIDPRVIRVLVKT